MQTDRVTPQIAGLVPAVAVGGLSKELKDASDALGLQAAQFADHGDGSLQADLDVPPGIWRYWSGIGTAIWIARCDPVIPPLPDGSSFERIELVQAVTRLHEAGHWVSELGLLDVGGWHAPLPFRDALVVLTDPSVTLLGISGYWSDSDGAARVEMFTDGQIWADDPLRAERFLLVATGRET